jgi:hypothetical protein
MVNCLPKSVAASLAAALLLTATLPAFSQQTSVASLTATMSSDLSVAAISPGEAEAILNKFVASEAEVREALNQHTFKRDVVLQTIGPDGEVTGEYIRNSQFVFDNRGKRIERVLYHPKSTISEMRITKEDIQDLAGAQLLGIDITEAGKYRLVIAGIETIDHRELIAVDVVPVVTPDPKHMSERFFVGRVWLDPIKYQMVKVKGIVEPQGKQRFPLFETWRDQVKGQFAFPTRTEADDILHFRSRDVHYRIKVRYYDYQLFGSRVEVKELDDVPPNEGDSNTPNATDTPKSSGPKAAPNKNSSKGATKISSYNEVRPSFIPKPADTESCTVNRTAPPVGAYHWPADTEVKVYFWRNFFTPEQRAAVLDAMATWTMLTNEIGSGVRFVDGGETDGRQPCTGCLTIRRSDVYKQDRHHYAFFYPMNRVDRLLVSAWIDLDFGITKPEALKGFMVHELAHGLGLWDCTSCKNKRTIMNAFPGLNKDNGLTSPSRCDVATVREVYQQERFIARAAAPRVTPVVNTPQNPIAGAASSQSSTAPRPTVVPVTSGAEQNDSNKRDETRRRGTRLSFNLPQPALRSGPPSLFEPRQSKTSSLLFGPMFWVK